MAPDGAWERLRGLGSGRQKKTRKTIFYFWKSYAMAFHSNPLPAGVTTPLRESRQTGLPGKKNPLGTQPSDCFLMLGLGETRGGAVGTQLSRGSYVTGNMQWQMSEQGGVRRVTMNLRCDEPWACGLRLANWTNYKCSSTSDPASDAEGESEVG